MALVRWGIAPSPWEALQEPWMVQCAAAVLSQGMPHHGCPLASATKRRCRLLASCDLRRSPSPCCSGGKDSCYNMVLCQQYGHEVCCSQARF